MQKLQQEILKEFDKDFIYCYEDYTEFDKHTYWGIKEFISDKLQQAYTAGLKRAIDVLPDDTICHIPVTTTEYKEWAITNITKEMQCTN